MTEITIVLFKHVWDYCFAQKSKCFTVHESNLQLSVKALIYIDACKLDLVTSLDIHSCTIESN